MPFVDLECGDLVSDAVLAPLVTEPVALRPVVVSQTMLISDGLPSVDEPDTFAPRLAGGFTCEWSNGVTELLESAQNPAYVGLVLRVLPDAQANWDSFAATAGVTGDRVEYCFWYTPAQCVIDTIVDGTWYSVELYGATGGKDAEVAAAGRTALDAAVAAIAAADEPAVTQALPAGTIALDEHDCLQFFDQSAIDSAFGLGLAANTLPASASIWGLLSASYAQSDRPYCSWRNAADPQDDHYYDLLWLSWIEGGEWAYDELADGGAFDTATALAVPGLGADESAVLSCGPEPEDCEVNLLVGHDWIWFTVGAFPEVTPNTSTAIATALATELVANLG